MRGLAVLGLLAALTGCDVLFQVNKVDLVDASPDDSVNGPDAAPCNQHTPRQQVTGAGNSASVTIPLAPTQVGGTLVLAAAIATTTHNIQTVTDDGNNVWHAAVSVQANVTDALDIWYTTTTAPATKITATLTTGRALGINISEWSCLQAIPFDGAATAPGANSTSATSAILATANSDLIIGAITFVDNATVATFSGGPEFVALSQFPNNTGSVGTRAVYAWAPPGTFEERWDLSPATTWVGGILALKAQ